MERYLGIDAHDESSTIAIVSPSGKKLKQVVVETNAKTIIEAIRGIAGKRYLCLEECPLSEWLYETLEPHVDEIEVVQADANAAMKSDARDAWWLAEVLRTNAARRRVYKSSAMRELREAVMGYEVTVNNLSRAKNRLNALIRSRAIKPKTDELYAPETREAWIKKLPAAKRARAQLLGTIVDSAQSAHDTASESLGELARKNTAVKRLMTAPGIGLVRAAIIVAKVISPHRFRGARQFWAYCGLSIVTHATSEWSKAPRGELRRKREVVQTRGLRQGHPLLKSVFKGAAHTVATMSSDHPLAQHYQRLIAQGTDPSLAWLTISRRIAAAVLAMWKNEEDYTASKQQPQTKTAA
jgi:transposase